MIETLKGYMPAWLFALIVMVLSSTATALAVLAAGGTWILIGIAVLSGILGPGLWSAPALAEPKPPAQPPAVLP
jgi:hypothetical protein